MTTPPATGETQDSACTTPTTAPPIAGRTRPVVVLLAGTERQRAAPTRAMASAGFVIEHVSAASAVAARIDEVQPDSVVLHVSLPALDGVEVCRQLKSNPATRLLPIVLLLDERDPRQELLGFEAGADACFPCGTDAAQLVARLNVLARVKRYTDGLEPITAVMTTVATLLETDKGYSEGHCLRMANYARAIGRRLGLSVEGLETLDRGAFLHDIGMLTVPSALVEKPGPLDHEEILLVQSHPSVGESLVATYRSLQLVRPLVLHHHERYDGSGYPHRLKGDEIPLLAQIVGLVDTFEAMTSPRPYRRTESVPAALDILRRATRLGKWRPDLVAHLTSVLCPWSLE